MKTSIALLSVFAALSACQIVPQDQQRAEAAARCADHGGYRGVERMPGSPALSHTCNDGMQVAVTNIRLGG